MKKKLLSLMFIVGSVIQLNAQCTITPGCTVGPLGYCTTPADNTSLPNATEGTAYSTVIQVSIGSSAGGMATINSATITSMTGLPAGLTYSINPTNGVVAPNSSACAIISGTPTSASSNTVVANVTVNTNLGAFPGSASWFLTVDPAVATGIKIKAQANDVMVISPNPASSELFVSATFHFGKVQIIDALGKIVISQEANYSSQTSIDVKNLNRGVYFLQANDGNKLITKKFIKD